MVRNNMAVLAPWALDQHRAGVVGLLRDGVGASLLAGPARKCELVAGLLLGLRLGGGCGGSGDGGVVRVLVAAEWR